MNSNHKEKTTSVAFFSDSLPERNGTGAYYFDLLESLKSEIPNIEIFQAYTGCSIKLFIHPYAG